MATLDESKRSRTTIKARLTLICKKVDSLDISSSKQEIVTVIEQLENRLKIYDECQSAVESLMKEEEIEKEMENSEEFRDTKVAFLVKARDLLERKSAVDTTNNSSINEGSESAFSTSRLHQAKLPRLQLPTFSGDYTQWQPFWDKFTAIVHRNSELPTVSKFTYLQSLLKGEALAAINGLALTEANYETARVLLDKRFGRKDRIVFGHIQALLNLPTQVKTTQDLWALHDKLQTHIRSLETLEITGATYGVILIPIVLHKLPENIRLEWARVSDKEETSEKEESNLTALLTFLHQEIVRRERSQTFTPAEPPSSTKKPAGRYTSSALHTSSGSSNTVSCNVCSKGHATEKCYSWKRLNVDSRKNQCFSKGLCFNCLMFHKVRDCRQKAKCRCPKLPGKHHPVLCKCDDTHDLGKDEKEDIPKDVKSLNVVNHSLRQTVLQVAEVTANESNEKMNILFDSGSDKSYISSSCVKRLGLSPIGREKISGALFGQSKPNECKIRNKFRLTLKTVEGIGEEMIVTESPTICTPIQRPKLPETILESLKRRGLKLASESMGDSDSHLNIDILIGLDYYWYFIKPNICPITDHLSAQESKFGWILSGSWEHQGGAGIIY